MILNRLLPPKWRKENADAKPSDKEVTRLAELATDPNDPAKRRQACKTLTDAVLLRKMATDDVDAGVREVASARLRRLLSGDEPGAPDLDSRIEQLNRADDSALASHLARNGKEPELRCAAVALTDDQRSLAETALSDSVAAVRLAAAERLQDKDTLERLARKIGKKDKKVYRLARQKIKDINEREQEPLRIKAEAESLCERSEKLGRTGTWTQDKALLEHIEHQWRELGDAVPADLKSRFQSARDTFSAGYESYRQENLAQIQEEKTRDQLQQDKQALLDQLNALQTDEADKLPELRARWDVLATLPNDLEKPLQKTFKDAAAALEKQLAKQKALAERTERLSALAEQAEKLLHQSKPLDHKQVARWKDKGDELAAMQPGDTPATRYLELRDKLNARMDKQIAHAKEKLGHLGERFDLLEAELDEGVLRKATSLHQSIHSELDLLRLSGIARREAEDFERRYKRLTPRLRELQNWRKWGTDQHRDELCARMETLIEAKVPLEQLTEQVQALQAEWKSLDKGGSPANEGLWKRFHGAADKAYDRCRPYLDEQTELRRKHREEREKLCAELEGFLDQVDWERMDWKKAVRAEREMRAAWSAMGPVEPRHRRKLEKRFHEAIKRLDGHLAGERARNKALKKGLIEQAQALIEEPDLEKAIDSIKKLQRQWLTTVPSKRKQENQLWQNFRDACDKVFERRKEQQQVRRSELAGNVADVSALCDELEALTGEDREALKQQLHKLQGRWNDTRRLDLPRKDSDRLQKRWRDGTQAVENRMAELQHAAEREQLNRLRELAALCSELESAVETKQADAASTESWRERWAALPQPKSQTDLTLVTERFEAALKTLQDEPAMQQWLAALADNGKTRSDLCLHLEVLTGIDSPPEATSERLAFQVNRLSDRLGHGGKDPFERACEVEKAWYLAPAVSASDAQTLEARFERARQAALNPTNNGN